jgi:hypothetical protein
MYRVIGLLGLCLAAMACGSGFAQPFSGAYEFVNANSGMVLDVRSQATTNGAPVIQWIGNGGGNQRWTMTSLGNGQYEIINVHSGLALEVGNQSTLAGAQVDQWSYSSGANQKWTISNLGNGYYQILNFNSGLALEVSGASLGTGANIDQSSWSGAAHQKWMLLPASVTGTVLVSSGGSGTAASNFRGFNWADPGDNFQDGPLLLSGLSVGNSYATVQSVAGVVVGAFQDAGANTVRIPINPATVLGSWWASYRGVIDQATSLGMKVIIAVWTGSSAKNGMVNDTPAFFKMWDTVVTAYNGNGNVYFELLNEPHGYSAASWLTVVSSWLNRYPFVARGRVFVGGTGYCQNIPAVATSPITQGCLYSVHDYGFWNSTETSHTNFYNHLAGEVGAYASRTVLTEFGAPMTTGLNYANGDQGNSGIASVNGFCDYCHDNQMGSVYWPGLRDGDSYSMFTRVLTFLLTLNNRSGLSVVQYAWPISSEQARIGFAATNGQYRVNWPADHLGWVLQAQTNSPANGLRSNWSAVQGSGSTNQVMIPINRANGSVFFRLARP